MWMERSPKLWLPFASFVFSIMDLSWTLILSLSLCANHSQSSDSNNIIIQYISVCVKINTAVSRTSQLAFSKFLPPLELRAATSKFSAPTRRTCDLDLHAGSHRPSVPLKISPIGGKFAGTCSSELSWCKNSNPELEVKRSGIWGGLIVFVIDWSTNLSI